MKTISLSLLALGLSAPAVLANPPTRWDSAPQGKDINGSVTVTTKDGKKHKDTTAYFTDSTVTLVDHHESILREDVKQVVIRERRDCCVSFQLPLVPFGLALLGADNATGWVLLTILYLPTEAVFIPATPLAAIVEAVLALTPGKVLYKVVP
jgi:hypothetical protein